MLMVKLRIPERSDRAKSLVEMARRGQSSASPTMSSSCPNLPWRCSSRSGSTIRNWAGEGLTMRKRRYEFSAVKA